MTRTHARWAFAALTLSACSEPARPDATRGFVGGSPVQNSVRLTKIQTFVGESEVREQRRTALFSAALYALAFLLTNVAHELAHIKHRDTLTMTIAATLAGAIGFLANFAFFFGGSSNSENRPNPIATILIMILAPMAAMLVQMAISRTREYSADRTGAEICGQPRWLASALQRIEQVATGRVMPTAERNPASAHMFIINPLRMGGVDNLFRTHPATADRIQRLLSLEQTGSAPMAARQANVRYGSVPRAGGRRGPWGN